MKRFFSSLLLLLLASPTWALTPENGFWWNPADTASRRGYSIEVQDNVLFFAGYLYQANGSATWFTSIGTLVVDNNADTARYDGVLDGSVGGPCITCPNRPATAQPGVGGPIRLEFFNETRARLTWAGGSIPIERFDFAVTPAGGVERTDSFLGQWQFMIDFAPITSQYPYYGDTLIINARSSDGIEQYVNGCRTTNTDLRTCTSADISANGASGFHFQENVGGVTKERVVIAVRDSSDRFLVYALDYGTYQVNGFAKQCSASIPANQRYSQCIRNSAIRALPARGLRTMSRSFMLGNNTAPKQVGQRAAVSMPSFSMDPRKSFDASEQKGWDAVPEAAFGALMQRLDASAKP